MPTRSTGCATCRRRKIRCDEARPVCNRCATHGVPCPGYRSEKAGGIEFKDQTDLTVQRANDQYRTKSSTPPRRPWGSPSHSTFDTRLNSPERDGWALACTVPQTFTSPSMNRSQLMDTFMALYLPRDMTNGNFTYMRILGELKSTQPALQESLDALTMVQIGSVHKSEVLLKQSTRSYAKAVGSLAKAIVQPDSLYNDEILAAVTILSTCEFFQEIAQHGDGWGKHVLGVQQILAIRGPQTLNTNLAFTLFHNSRNAALCHALIFRKAPFFAREDWLKVSREGLNIDNATAFVDVAVKIPGLLEECDNMSRTGFNVQDVDDLLAASSLLEVQMLGWLNSWHTSLGKTPYNLVAIDDFKRFTSLCPDRTFKTGLRFPTFLIAYLQTLYWVCMFHLRKNTQDLQYVRLGLQPRTEIENLVGESELMSYVTSLCQSIPFFVEPQSSSTGSIGIFMPLRVAMMYSREHWMLDILRWCANVRDNVFVNGLFPPNAGERMTFNDWAATARARAPPLTDEQL